MASNDLGTIYLESVAYRFVGLKAMGERAMAQLSDADLAWSANEETNSIATIVQHLHGNQMSRWTDFLASDGEKESRDRDGEFARPESPTGAELTALWDEGWGCLMTALASLTAGDLAREVLIRGQGLSVVDALNRQVSHYGQHVGQIVYIAKERLGAEWKTLSIPRGQSKAYKPNRGPRD